MYDLFLQLALMFSLGAIVYLVTIAVPRVKGGEESSPVNGILSKVPLHRVDSAISKYRDKFLRRLKVLIMKADNIVGKRLQKDKDSDNLKNGSDSPKLE
ncbi:MAG: hypothetical protein HYS87_02405 [Candidatus Colwellbacteria bacterium]|nr:hypothetical protein [Candidatus Colwellbacteria bacterium]